MDPLAGFDSANELAKQLITLATGILALSITFMRDVLKNNSSVVTWPLKTAWIGYLLSMCFGMWTMMAITGSIFSAVSDSNRSVAISNQSVMNSNQSATNSNQSVASSNTSITNSNQSKPNSNPPLTYETNIAIPFLLQGVAFLSATIFLIWYGAKMLRQRIAPE